MSQPLHVWQDADGTVWVTRIGRGWLAVPDTVWTAFTAKVRSGAYDRK